MLARLKIILTSAVTYGMLAVFVLTVVAEEIPAAGGIVAQALAVLLPAIAVVRRVTPVLPEERGLLPAVPVDDV
jgi:hypothetical protein